MFAAAVEQPSPHAPLPKPQLLHDPVLRVFGRLTGFSTQVSVQLGAACRLVITEIGMDPDNLPSNWTERDSKSRVPGFERVRWAIRSLVERKNPLIVRIGSSSFGLTDEGSRAAAELLPPPPVSKVLGPNVTSVWLQRHMTPLKGQRKSDLHRMMETALTKHLPVSARTHQIEDHVQTYLLRAIRRDAFRKIIEAGGDLPYSKVVAYCINSGRTDARDMGTEPVCRTLYGARTERERKDVTKQKNDEMTEIVGARTWDSDGAIVPQDDVQLPNDESFESTWARLEQVIQGQKPQAWNRYMGVLAMLAQGMTTREIADAEGVSRNRAATLLGEARRAVRRGLMIDETVNDLI